MIGGSGEDTGVKKQTLLIEGCLFFAAAKAVVFLSELLEDYFHFKLMKIKNI